MNTMTREQKMAAGLTVNYNPERNGIEVRFNFGLEHKDPETGKLLRKHFTWLGKKYYLTQKEFVTKVVFANRWFGAKNCYWAKLDTPTYELACSYIDAMENKGYKVEVLKNAAW